MYLGKHFDLSDKTRDCLNVIKHRLKFVAVFCKIFWKATFIAIFVMHLGNMSDCLLTEKLQVMITP